MLLDIHCHLTDSKFANLDQTIRKCIDNDVEVIVSAGLNPEDNRKVLDLSKKYEIVKASLGFYPIDALSFSNEQIENEIEFIRNNKNRIIAISEVGLDYLYSDEKQKQKQTFQKFIDLAEEIHKPLIVHTRKAEEDVITMLESSNAKEVVFHSFGGNKKLISRIIEKKWFFSIPPVIVRSSNFQTLVEMSPLNLLLTESDSPYQSPYKNEINQPFYVKEAVNKISEIKKLNYEETEKIIFMNFQKMSKKWKTI